MKANELMIGDWVDIKATNSFIYKRRKITANDLIDSIHRECVYIPLTAEILEKNGFVRSSVFVEWKYERNGICMIWKPFPWLQVSTDNADVNFECEYVHELQHALRLCGIDKEIVL